MLPALAIALTLGARAEPGLTVVIRGADVRTVELGCRGGHRERRTPRRTRPDADPQVTFSRVPEAECTAFFKGVTPARYGPLPQSGTLICQLDGRVARCAVPDAPSAPAPPAARATGPTAPPAPPVQTRPTAPPAHAPAPAPAGTSGGALEIHLLDAPGVSGFELTCRSGGRVRATRARDDLPTRFPRVPGEECRLNFRGTPPAIVHRVTPGTALHCELKGVTALCETRPLGD